MSPEELRWTKQIYIIPAKDILRVRSKGIIILPCVDQLHERPSMIRKVKVSVRNWCDSHWCFWIISQIKRLQIRLRISWESEGEEIFFVFTVLLLQV